MKDKQKFFGIALFGADGAWHGLWHLEGQLCPEAARPGS